MRRGASLEMGAAILLNKKTPFRVPKTGHAFSVGAKLRLMMTGNESKALLVLYNLARQDEHADLAIVAERLGLSCVQADEALVSLERRGLVDADRVRLTMTGLVVAVSADARKKPRPTVAGRRRSTWRAA